MGAKRHFFSRARTPSLPPTQNAPFGKRIVKPALLTIALSGAAFVLMDGIMVERASIGGHQIGEVIDTAVQSVIAANPARHDRSPQTLARLSPLTTSSPNTLVRVATNPAATDADAASSGRHPMAVSTAPTTSSAPARLSFGVGDKLKIAFYERLNVEEDKWARAVSALRGIQQRPELSGEYTVEEDGTIAIPLLGGIRVTGRSAQQVHDAIDEAFTHLLGRKGMVNIVLLERAPIYVLGPVKNPGSFKYVPGATVLHALAMAGGLDRGTSDPWSKVEAVREIQKRSGAAGAVVKLMARDAVLKAERDGTAPKIPLRLMELVGASEATRLVNEQSDRRKSIMQARKDRERAIMKSIESARQELSLYGHTTSLDNLVKTRQERVDNTRALVERNVVAKSMLSQVESELSDAEQRRQDAINQYGMAKQRLAALAAEGFKVHADLENDLATEIDAVERQIADSERELNTSEGILRSLPVTRAAFTPAREASGISYQIVRRTASGPVNIAADGMTLLQPGDLVNVAVGPDAAAGLPALSSDPTTPVLVPGEGSPPVGRNASRQITGATIAQE